jgi:EmrB/QacA subfamily drug resistance transporter
MWESRFVTIGTGDGFSDRRKAAILAICCLSALITGIDLTIANLAIPAIRTDLAATVAHTQWVIAIYALVVASLQLLGGAAGDRFGRRRVLQIGMTIFTLGSLLCSLAPIVDALIAARALQAIGASMTNPVALAIIAQVFIGPAERARAIGVWGAVFGTSLALGPVVGGVLIDLFGWRSVFWINLPVCATAIVACALLVPESRSATIRGIDPIGQSLIAGSLFGLVFVLIESPGRGWTHPWVIGIAAAAACAFVGFLRYESRHADPFVDLRFFRSIPFTSAVVTALFVYIVWGAFMFMMSIYLQGWRGYPAARAGLLLLPVGLAVLVFAPVSGRLVGRVGSRPSLLTAGLMIAAMSTMLAFLTPRTPLWTLVVIFVAFGVTFGMVTVPINYAAVSGMPQDRAGAAAGITSTSKQVGISLGVALSGVLAAGALSPPAGDFTASADPLWLFTFALGLAIAALAIISTSPRAVRSAERLVPLIDSDPSTPAVTRHAYSPAAGLDPGSESRPQVEHADHNSHIGSAHHHPREGQ